MNPETTTLAMPASILSVPAVAEPSPGPSEPDLVVPREVWAEELGTRSTALSWLWHGYLAAGNLTLLTSPAKTGKTTLIALLLAQLRDGGTFAGRPLVAGKAAIVSEEEEALWDQRRRQLGLGNHVCFFCRPFRSKPTPGQWRALIDRLVYLRQQHGIGLVAIDPLAHFLPGRNENHAGLVVEALLPLQELTCRGVSVLVVHHPRKEEAPAGHTARGSSALTAHADIIVELHPSTHGKLEDRRRLVRAMSRYTETPSQWMIELSPDGRVYQGRGDFTAEDFMAQWERLRHVLQNARHKLTRQGILEEWPEEVEKPAETTLRRWLEMAHERQLVQRCGTGQKHSPYRYWLPGCEKHFLLPDLDDLRENLYS
jgi:hypothetical protein